MTRREDMKENIAPPPYQSQTPKDVPAFSVRNLKQEVNQEVNATATIRPQPQPLVADNRQKFAPKTAPKPPPPPPPPKPQPNFVLQPKRRAVNPASQMQHTSAAIPSPAMTGKMSSGYYGAHYEDPVLIELEQELLPYTDDMDDHIHIHRAFLPVFGPPVSYNLDPEADDVHMMSPDRPDFPSLELSRVESLGSECSMETTSTGLTRRSKYRDFTLLHEVA
jgi:hypothetical protein